MSVPLSARPTIGRQPSSPVKAADFLEGQIDRVDEFYQRKQLRHLQLVHYHINSLGDIQTEPARYGGLTDFGAAVIKRCNSIGIVVDVAHGPYDLVKRAADVTSKPLVLSHTSLSPNPGPQSRLISPEHAQTRVGHGPVSSASGRLRRAFRTFTRWPKAWRGWSMWSASTMSVSVPTCLA